jgi:radical SAM protein with 4Fe4S-binding SPASM domain
MSDAVSLVERAKPKTPRLPLEGGIDLTYRCNNNCRHCWVNRPDTERERAAELSTDEWRDIIDQARALGTRRWALSGGEPLLREDFEAIYAHILRRASYISVNTNGTLITKSLARAFRTDFHILVSLYGATADVHDHITRSPGSYDAALRGIFYLKEAGHQPIIQIVPLADNFHQWSDMNALARALSPAWRLGAACLMLSASGDESKNDEIRAQRLPPERIVDLNPPNVAFEERHASPDPPDPARVQRKYGFCLAEREMFHIDPAGRLSFCCFIRESSLRYDLKKGRFSEAWDRFLPSLADRAQIGPVFNDACRDCGLKEDCQRCPGVSYLEHRGASAPSPYLCRLNKEEQEHRRRWKARHQRHFRIAGITITVNSEREFKDDTFNPALRAFAVETPGDDVIQLDLFFSLPPWDDKRLGELVYDQAPWLIYRKEETWTYFGYLEENGVKTIHRLAVFTDGHARGRLYLASGSRFSKGGLNSLSMLPSDQDWLLYPLLRRRAFYVHSCGLVVDGKGMLFVGHSRTGKSTIAKLFAGRAELLCDDRTIVRDWPKQGWMVHGTWSHGELPGVSASPAPLTAVFFLEKSGENACIPIRDPMEIRQRLFPCLPRTYVDDRWWEGIWPLISKIAAEVPSYVLRFDKSDAVVPLIRGLNPGRNPDRSLAAEPADRHDRP